MSSRELRARIANVAAPGNRAGGMPAPGSAAYEQFGAAAFNMDFQTGYVTVSGTLGWRLRYGDLPSLAVQAGVLNGNNCSGLPGELGGAFGTTGSASDIDPIPAGWASATCVIALVFPNGSIVEPSDALVALLTDVTVYPTLSMGKPEVLGVKKLNLVLPRRLDAGQRRGLQLLRHRPGPAPSR